MDMAEDHQRRTQRLKLSTEELLDASGCWLKTWFRRQEVGPNVSADAALLRSHEHLHCGAAFLVGCIMQPACYYDEQSVT